jgi:type VI secretion system secreted protein Hcp
MAIDMFLKLDSVTGESTDSSHAQEIEVASFSHSVSNQSTVGSGTSGSGAGKASFGALKIVARTNNSSATLFQVSASGDHFKTAKLTARKAGKSQQEYFTIELTEVYVSEYTNGYQPLDANNPGSEVAHVDMYSLSYKTIKITYKPQKADGTLGAPAIGQYNLGNNSTKV